MINNKEKTMSNDSILLDQILGQKKSELKYEGKDSDFFEIFTSEQILKEYELSYEEINYGIVGDGGDGGIDSIYTLVNGDLVIEDSDFAKLKQDISIDIVINQAKTSPSFEEGAIDRLKTSFDELFDLAIDIKKLKAVYNDKLLLNIENFRMIYLQLASKFPKMRITVNYITKGDEVHPNVSRKTAQLESVVKTKFSNAEYAFKFIGANNLLELCRKVPNKTYYLDLTETPISCTGDSAYICLASLNSYFKFFIDDSNKIIKNIFEANVRDYQGKTTVNDQILYTLENPGEEDFWWLNNGITILASRVTPGSKQLLIENPEIVNGLQTSSEVYNYFSQRKPTAEKRTVLIRVIVPKSSESRDKIIRATNSQTQIPSSSLRSTDKIQRDIEEYLKPFGWYYDRRKNYYKNLGKPVDRIISISLLAQSIMSILLLKPDFARARPSTLIREDEDYLKIFNTKYPIALYKIAIEMERLIDKYLRTKLDNGKDKNNCKYYMLMLCCLECTNKKKPKAEDIEKIKLELLTEDKLEIIFNVVYKTYKDAGGTDQAAKGSVILTNILADR
jgi:hypothetical protein